MSLGSLAEHDLERYVSENQDTGKCWFFVHIPKTAGSSFRSELASLLSPNYNVHIEGDRRPVSYSQKIIDATKRFNERLKRQPCRFASGHIPVSTLAKHVQGWQDLKLLTMLRDPVQRVISDYRYQTTPEHPSHLEFLERFPSFGSYVETEWTANRMFEFLRPSADATLQQCVDFIVARFAFVGVFEMYPLSIRLVTRLMGQERWPSQHLRKTVETEHNRIEPSPQLLDRIRQLNELDLELYNVFHAKLASIPQAMFDPPAVEQQEG
jgi:hypothetical protein